MDPISLQAAQPDAANLAFRQLSPGEFAFDTGVVKGRLGPPGRGNGLSTVVHLATGTALDRGANGHGIFSHYRVFGNGQRYGVGAWEWPKETQLLEDGSVELRWASAPDRPFAMRAVYRWSAADALDLVTHVRTETAQEAFEVFLASYFTESFTNALVCAKTPAAHPWPSFVAAEQALGVWQMFPRDDHARTLIADGRWKLPPHPVDWVLRPELDQPIAIRRSPGTGVTAVLMAAPTDCFAIATPYETESHYSTYLSLGGRDLKAGESIQLRARLWIASNVSGQKIGMQYQSWVKSLRNP